VHRLVIASRIHLFAARSNARTKYLRYHAGNRLSRSVDYVIARSAPEAGGFLTRDRRPIQLLSSHISTPRRIAA